MEIRRGGCGGGLGIVAGDGEDVLDAESIHVFKGGAQIQAITADAGEMNVGREAAGARGGAYANGVLAEGSAGRKLAMMPPATTAGTRGQVGRDLEAGGLRA